MVISVLEKGGVRMSLEPECVALAELDSILSGRTRREAFFGRGYNIQHDGREYRGRFDGCDLVRRDEYLVVTKIVTDGGDPNVVLYDFSDGLQIVVGGLVPFKVDSITIEPK